MRAYYPLLFQCVKTGIIRKPDGHDGRQEESHADILFRFILVQGVIIPSLGHIVLIEIIVVEALLQRLSLLFRFCGR